MEETVLGPSFQQLTFNVWLCGLSEGLSLGAFDFLPPWRETVGEGRRRQFWKEAEGRSGRTVIEEARYGNVGAEKGTGRGRPLRCSLCASPSE